MVCDALALAAGPLGLREAAGQAGDVSAYLQLDDSLLQRLAYLRPEEAECPGDIVKVRRGRQMHALAAARVCCVRCACGCAVPERACSAPDGSRRRALASAVRPCLLRHPRAARMCARTHACYLQAQGLLASLARRRLYKFVAEVTLDVAAQGRYRGVPSAEEIVGFQSSAATGVSGLQRGWNAPGMGGCCARAHGVRCIKPRCCSGCRTCVQLHTRLSADARHQAHRQPPALLLLSAPPQVQLCAADVIVCETRIDQGMAGANPMSAVRFYQTHDAAMGDEVFPMPQQQVSVMLGTVYQVRRSAACEGRPVQGSCTLHVVSARTAQGPGMDVCRPVCMRSALSCSVLASVSLPLFEALPCTVSHARRPSPRPPCARRTPRLPRRRTRRSASTPRTTTPRPARH